MFLLLAALPALFWDGAPDSAPALRDAGIHQIVVATRSGASGRLEEASRIITVDDGGSCRAHGQAAGSRGELSHQRGYSATNAPRLTRNGWRFIRQASGRFYYEAPGKPAALAAAEAFSYGANAMIHTDSAGLKPLAEMLAFLRSIPDEALPPVADIGYIDDGSAASGEVMNLMVRDNLLFHVERSPRPDRRLKLNVKLGSKEYPLEDAKNPSHHRSLGARQPDGRQTLRPRLRQPGGGGQTHGLGQSGPASSVELRGGGPQGGRDSRARLGSNTRSISYALVTRHRASNSSTTLSMPKPPEFTLPGIEVPMR